MVLVQNPACEHEMFHHGKYTDDQGSDVAVLGDASLEQIFTALDTYITRVQHNSHVSANYLCFKKILKSLLARLSKAKDPQYPETYQSPDMYRQTCEELSKLIARLAQLSDLLSRATNTFVMYLFLVCMEICQTVRAPAFSSRDIITELLLQVMREMGEFSKDNLQYLVEREGTFQVKLSELACSVVPEWLRPAKEIALQLYTILSEL